MSSEATHNNAAVGCLPTDPNACQVSSGRYVNIWNFSAKDVRRQDIVNALSKICRFNGHCYEFYSVAQHSVHVAERVHNLTLDPYMARLALYHDAAEAYIGDVCRPIKRHPSFAAFRQLDGIVSTQIELALKLWDGIADSKLSYAAEMIRQADNEILRIEANLFMPGGGRQWNWPGPMKFTRMIVALPPRESAILFDNYENQLKEMIADQGDTAEVDSDVLDSIL